MGGQIYTNSDGLVSASNDFISAAGKIGTVKETFKTVLYGFIEDMQGGAVTHLHICTVQMNGELFVANDRFSAISELLMNLLYARSGMDNNLGLNAAGKIQEPAGTRLIREGVGEAARVLKEGLE